MDFTGYDALSMDADEQKLLKALHRLSKRDRVEYGIAAHGLWTSAFFTDRQPNSVHIPPDILSMDAFSLYHAHTNETLLSAQDLRLLLNPKVEKIAVITPGFRVACVSVGNGYRPDIAEFNEVVNKIYISVNMEILNNPLSEDMTILERNLFSINEQCYRLARYFKWHMEGGEL